MEHRTAALPVNRDICFSDHKQRQKKRIQKLEEKILFKLEPFLKNFLEPDEVIQYATPACSPFSIFEQITTGWVIAAIRKCVLIITNKRILHIPVNNYLRAKNSISQVRFGDIQEFKVKGGLSGRLILKYKSGKKEQFPFIAAGGASKLKSILPQLIKGGETTGSRERGFLCPKCKTVLKKDSYTCPECRLEFKDKSKALKYSLIYPGGGYFYTNHPVMGIGDALVETIFLIAVAGSLVKVFVEGNNDGYASLAVFGLFLFYEKLVSVYHSRHYVAEYIPVEKEIAARK